MDLKKKEKKKTEKEKENEMLLINPSFDVNGESVVSTRHSSLLLACDDKCVRRNREIFYSWKNIVLELNKSKRENREML